MAADIAGTAGDEDALLVDHVAVCADEKSRGFGSRLYVLAATRMVVKRQTDRPALATASTTAHLSPFLVDGCLLPATPSPRPAPSCPPRLAAWDALRTLPPRRDRESQQRSGQSFLWASHIILLCVCAPSVYAHCPGACWEPNRRGKREETHRDTRARCGPREHAPLRARTKHRRGGSECVVRGRANKQHHETCHASVRVAGCPPRPALINPHEPN